MTTKRVQMYGQWVTVKVFPTGEKPSPSGLNSSTRWLGGSVSRKPRLDELDKDWGCDDAA